MQEYGSKEANNFLLDSSAFTSRFYANANAAPYLYNADPDTAEPDHHQSSYTIVDGLQALPLTLAEKFLDASDK